MIVMFIFTVEAILWFFLIRFIYSFIRAFKIISDTLKKLEAVCDRRGYKLEKHRGIASMILFMPKETDVTIKGQDKEYRIRTISCLYTKKSYHFATVEHIVTWYPQIIKILFKKAESFYNGFTSYRYCPRLKLNETEDDKVENILLFDPSPFELTTANEHGFHIAVEDGDAIGPYKAYRAKAFLEMLGAPAQSIE